MFLSFGTKGLIKSGVSALILVLTILLGIAMTFVATNLLSKTLLRGIPSSFTLELPPYRKPQIRQVIVRSVLDRTLFVLARAVAVAAPAGLIIWLSANISIGDKSLLLICSSALEPIGRLMGLDGIILMSFILSLPANETVIPIMAMAYSGVGVLSETGTSELSALLSQNGWTPVTAICMIVFCLFHWPCSTTLLTIKKETGSIMWAALSVILPTVFGVVICILINLISKLF